MAHCCAEAEGSKSALIKMLFMKIHATGSVERNSIFRIVMLVFNQTKSSFLLYSRTEMPVGNFVNEFRNRICELRVIMLKLYKFKLFIIKLELCSLVYTMLYNITIR